MADRSNSTSGGIGFLGLLTIVFIVLKLLHGIAWSWWWVLAPLWGPAAAFLAFAAVAALIGGAMTLSKGRR